MRSFRARVERGRIIVHEPIDLPDGVVYLVPLEGPPQDTRVEATKDSNGSARTVTPGADSDQTSSSS